MYLIGRPLVQHRRVADRDVREKIHALHAARRGIGLLGHAYLVHHRHEHVVRNVGLEQQRRVGLLGELLLELREVLGELREVVALVGLVDPAQQTDGAVTDPRTVISSWKLGGCSLAWDWAAGRFNSSSASLTKPPCTSRKNTRIVI